MPEEEKQPMIDVGEEEGAEINFDENNEQIKEPVAEEKLEVEQVKEEEKPVEAKEEKKDEKEDELEKYSEGVQKRISKLTRKMREAERQREEAIAYAQLEKRKREEYENRYSKLDQSYVSEFETRVKTNLEAARAALRNAIESGDVDSQVKAQEQLAVLNADATRLANLKAQNEVTDQEKKVNITPQQYETVNNYQGYDLPKDVPTDAKAEAWAAKNAWFGNDSAMTYTAFDLHKKLVEDEGYDPKSDEYYSEIDKRIRLEFPHKFARVEDNATERAKPAQTVASAKRPSATGRRKTVKLTPSQVAIAKRLGVPLEEYAKQLTTKEA